MVAISADACVSTRTSAPSPFRRAVGSETKHSSVPLEESASAFPNSVYGESNPATGEGWFPLRKFGLFLGEDLISEGTVGPDSH